MAVKTHFQRQQGTGYENVPNDYRSLEPCGNIFYVDSTSTAASDSAGSGRSPEAPFATIAYAVATAATATNHDLIRVMPGHTETITGAAGIVMSKAGVHVRGEGRGRNRPIINYTTSTAASFDVTAANCVIENIVFKPLGIDAVVAAINVTAADCSFINCEIEHANATNQAALCILTSALADRLVVDGCFFHGSADAGTNAAISMVGGNEITIRGCRIYGSYHASNGVILNATTDSLNLTIAGCTIINRTASSSKVIVLTSTSTGAIHDCIFGILSGTAPITAAALDTAGRNYYKAAAGVAAGTLL